MSQEIEIEFKTLLHKNEFDTLKDQLPFPEQPVKQINYYFDTEEMTLKQLPAALRIRERNRNFTLTLKQPQHKQILETHDLLTENEKNQWLHGNPVLKENIGAIFAEEGINAADLIYFGSLTTERYLYQTDGLEIVLDHSSYLGCEDYELELETDCYEKGEQAFLKILRDYRIKRQEPISKIARFFDRLNKG